MASTAEAVTPTSPLPRRRLDWVLLGLLVVSLGLRVALLRNGGPEFWGDETRYESAVDAVKALRSGDMAGAAHAIFAKADHMGFKVAMILPAWGQAGLGWSDRVVALLGSGLFSTLNIVWVYALARRVGAPVAEARWAAFLLAASASMFYWSRHLVPYDMALYWGLACLYTGLRPASRWHHSLLAGVLGFLAFVTYNGAWLLIAFALVVHVLRGWPAWEKMLLRGGFGLLGLAGSLGLLVIGSDFAGLDLLGAYRDFAGTIKQGDFSDGGYVLGQYLWQAEHGIMVVWMGAALVFVGEAVGRREKTLGRPGLYFGGFMAIGTALILFSNVFEQFVVYGRLVRQTVPFLSLLGGWALARLVAMRWAGRWLRPVLVACLLVLTAANFARPLAQEFPGAFHVKCDNAITAYVERLPDKAAQMRTRAKFRFLYKGFIWPVPEHYDLPPHEVLLQSPHPLQYEPFLFEGFDRRQRQAIHETDISMRLILIKD
ncbi:MAG: hypothetical protein EXS39_00040 [Opitutaceae bacterium]|nr:hypothetical protein [Opitutaceae bacterium]